MYWNLWMEFCWEFPEAWVKPLDKPPVFQISAWPSRCETTVSSSQWDTVSHRHVGMQAGSGHSQEQAGSVTATNDDQGEYFFCFSQLLVTLVAEPCIFPPHKHARNIHAILGYTVGLRWCSYSEGFNEGSRWADDRVKCTLWEGASQPHYCHTCSVLEQLRYNPSNHFTGCQNTASAYYFRYFRQADAKLDMFVLWYLTL